MSRDEWRGIAIGSFTVTIFSIGILFWPTGGWAPQPLIRMGVVNWEQVLMEYEQFQKEMKKLRQREQELQQYLKGDTTPQKITDREFVPDDEMGNMSKELVEQLNDRRQEIVQNRHQAVLNAIEQEAIRQGYSLVLSENEVLYASEEYTDLTRDVINRLNQNSQSN